MSKYGIDPEKTADVLDTHAEFAAATLMREMAARITTLEAQVATATPATEQTAPAAWIDGHPQLEAIAAAVWEQCGRSDSGSCMEDDPRNIAVAAYAAVLPAPADRAALLRDLADLADRCEGHLTTQELRRLAVDALTAVPAQKPKEA